METLNLASLAAEYSDEVAARLKFEEMRWGKGCKDVTCPHCGVVGLDNSYRVKVGPGSSTRPGLWRCRSCKSQFTVTKGTVFEDSHVPLTKWLLALYLLAASKKGMSAHQIHRMLKVKYQTAWFMMHRLRYAMGVGPLADKLRGVVEMDETYMGGKRKGGKGRVPSEARKAMVVALVERDGRARAFPMARIDAENAHAMIRKHVDPFAAGLMTDDAAHYSQPKFGKFEHKTVGHARGEYVRGNVHTNTVEGFFSLLKRGIIGTFHHIGTEHLDTAKCTYWQSNDGDGLNARDSVKLADVLQCEIDNGNTAAYAAIREAEIHRLPDERCPYCNATGVRDDRVGQENGFLDRMIPADAENHPRAGQRGWCNACDGKGFRRPSDASYPFSVENVTEWIEFLRGCGGFKIY